MVKVHSQVILTMESDRNKKLCSNKLKILLSPNFQYPKWSESLTFSLTIEPSQCYKSDGTGRNADCPVCSTHLNELGRNLPYAHCAQSRLICNITGHPLDENNPPMMLPNGHVYGYNVSITGV